MSKKGPVSHLGSRSSLYGWMRIKRRYRQILKGSIFDWKPCTHYEWYIHLLINENGCYYTSHGLVWALPYLQSYILANSWAILLLGCLYVYNCVQLVEWLDVCVYLWVAVCESESVWLQNKIPAPPIAPCMCLVSSHVQQYTCIFLCHIPLPQKKTKWKKKNKASCMPHS